MVDRKNESVTFQRNLAQQNNKGALGPEKSISKRNEK